MEIKISTNNGIKSACKYARYDAIIIGAGPSGAASAFYLSRNFNKILLLDKSKFPRHKLCGGAISNKSYNILKQDFSISDSDLGKKFNGGSIYCKNKHIKTIYTDKHLSLVMRYDLDFLLVKKAIENGVEFLDNTKITEININKGTVVINNKLIKTNYIIAADGAPSGISLAAGLFDVKDISKSLVMSYEYNVNYNKIGTHTREQLMNKYKQPVLIFGYSDNGYAWIFPKKNYLTVGILDIKLNGKKIKSILIKLTKQLLPEIDITKINIKGHYLPYYLPNKTVKKGKLYVVGDAAGTADPILGEGIYYALFSAKLLSYAIQTQKDYAKLINKYITREFRYAKFMRDLFYVPRIRKIILAIIRDSNDVAKALMDIVDGDKNFSLIFINFFKEIPKFIFYSFRFMLFKYYNNSINRNSAK